MTSKSKVTDSMLDNLYIKPLKNKGENKTHYPQFEKNFIHQADLLFLPHDDKYKYALVVIDIGSRLVDAYPVKEKSSQHIINAFNQIYRKSKYLEKPKVISVDSGTEFKGDVGKYFEDELEIKVKTAIPGRHRQQGVVEIKNKDIGKLLFRRMTAEELLTGHPATSWVSDLPKVIDEINAKTLKKKTPKVKEIKPTDYKCAGDACNMLMQGTKVRVALDLPRDVATGKRLPGAFRESDIRWEIKPRTIMKTLVSPGTVPMYLVDDDKGNINYNVAYTKNQLQVIPINEKLPDSSLIRGNTTNNVKKYVVEKLLDRKKEKNKIMFLVKYKGYNEPEWHARKDLFKDIPELIKDFEKK